MKSNGYSIRITIILILYAFLLQSCFFTNYSIIVSEHDEVKSTDRFKLRFTFTNEKEFYTSLAYVKQTILKEINSENISKYTIFEEISLNSGAFKLKDEMYIIVDSEIFPHKINNAESERYITISEDTGNILTSDSTNVNIVTGYNTNENIRIKHFYSLDNTLIQAISNAKKVSFRYYSGPDKITISLNVSELSRFKELINKTRKDKQ